MNTIRTNISSQILQSNLKKTNNAIETSIERLSTGFKINRASDDAANMSISKKMENQISGNKIAQDNTQQAVNLLQTADDSLDIMQSNILKIRELTVQAMNGTYSEEEKAKIQAEIDQLLEETYKQKNNTTFNKINIFGEEEAAATNTSTTTSTSTATSTAGTHEVTKLTEEEAIAQGYTCIHNETEFSAMVTDMGWSKEITGKYCLMTDIDFSKVSGWGEVNLDGEFNGNGYSINNLTINSTTNSDMQALFYSLYSGDIKNLNLNNVNIDTTARGYQGTAALLATWTYHDTSTIDNCSVSGTIKGADYTGGLVGTAHYIGTISNCSSSATIIGTDYTGGLVGQSDSDGTITNCTATGSVTGGNYTGGIIGYNGGDITNCSSSATVTGTYKTGGLVGENKGGTIDKSYSTGDVSGTTTVGGLVGSNSNGNISNSYALGNVSGDGDIGGLAGIVSDNSQIINSYSTGNVSSTGTMGVGGCIGAAIYVTSSPGVIENCYTTSELDFYGTNLGGTISNCHGTTTQDGVTAHDASWFEDSSNLSFLGSAYDLRFNPPDLTDNSRGEDPPTPTSTETTFQIGANSGEENTLTIDTSFSLNNLSVDVMTLEAAKQSLDDIDTTLKSISTKRAEIGATQNRLESIQSSLTTGATNLEASLSTIQDTDYASESSNLVKNEILRSITISLLAQANANPEIALKLLS